MPSRASRTSTSGSGRPPRRRGISIRSGSSRLALAFHRPLAPSLPRRRLPRPHRPRSPSPRRRRRQLRLPHRRLRRSPSRHLLRLPHPPRSRPPLLRLLRPRCRRLPRPAGRPRIRSLARLGRPCRRTRRPVHCRLLTVSRAVVACHRDAGRSNAPTSWSRARFGAPTCHPTRRPGFATSVTNARGLRVSSRDPPRRLRARAATRRVVRSRAAAPGATFRRLTGMDHVAWTLRGLLP